LQHPALIVQSERLKSEVSFILTASSFNIFNLSSNCVLQIKVNEPSALRGSILSTGNAFWQNNLLFQGSQLKVPFNQFYGKELEFSATYLG
jgi:hypothetical protein